MIVFTEIDWDYEKCMTVEPEEVTIAEDGGLAIRVQGANLVLGIYDGVVCITKVDAFGAILSKVAVKDL